MSYPFDHQRSDRPVKDLADLLSDHVLSPEAARFLLTAIQTRQNLLITGDAKSGKTSVLRALAEAAIDPQDRVIVLEHSDELRLAHPNCLHWVAEKPITLPDLMPRALFMRADYIIIGELHGREAENFLEAGLTESAGLLATMRLGCLGSLHYRLFWTMATANHWDWDAFRYDILAAQIAQAVDLIVHMEHRAEGFRLTRIAQPQNDGSLQTYFSWNAHEHCLQRVDTNVTTSA